MDGRNQMGSSKSIPGLTITEEKVGALWCESLQLTRLDDPSANFFELGGDSMTMVMLEFRINEEFGILLPANAVLSTPGLRELSATVDSLIDRGAQNGLSGTRATSEESAM